jgi:hypothetical protein
MQRRVIVCVVLLALCWGASAWAVTPQDTSLPFDSTGAKVYNSARSVWVPLIVFGALIALAVVFIAGSRSLAGHSIRTVIAIAILAVACTGAIAAFFPGLIVALTLP